MIDKQKLIELRKDVMKKEFSRMNNVQQKAVFHINGPLLVLAGAGSGKTTVLVNRIANMMEFGNAYNSEEISDRISEEHIAEIQEYLNSGEHGVTPVGTVIRVDHLSFFVDKNSLCL